MTAQGPGPGWHLDPEGSGKERYWNGSAWTGVFRPARTGKALVYGQGAGRSDPKQDAGPLRVGQQARVIASDYAHHGQIGTVDDVSSASGTSYVDLLFAGDPVAYTFGRDEVVYVAPGQKNRIAPAEPAAQASVTRTWAKLSTGSRIAVLAAPAVILGIVLAVGALGRDEDSYAAGLEDGRTYGQTYAVLGGGTVSNAQLESSCKLRTSIAGVKGVYWSQGRIEADDLDKDAYRDGCVKGALSVFGRR